MLLSDLCPFSRVLFLILMLELPLPAPEKSSYPHAESIVTGIMHPFWKFPFFDGWHFFSTLDVDGHINGKPIPTARIRYHWVCRDCDHWAMIQPFPELHLRSIWFIKRVSASVWSPDAVPYASPGWGSIKYLTELKNNIAAHKRLPILQEAKPRCP